MLTGSDQNGTWRVSLLHSSDYVDAKSPAGRRDLNCACHSGGTCGGGFANFHVRCLGEFRRADSEQVENVVGKGK